MQMGQDRVYWRFITNFETNDYQSYIQLFAVVDLSVVISSKRY